MTTVWVPCDAAAVALGADDVADAIAAAGVTVRRNGSRGMLWLEPLVEVETERGRVGYGNLTEAEVGPLLDGGARRHRPLHRRRRRARLAHPAAPRVVRPGRASSSPPTSPPTASTAGCAGCSAPLALAPEEVVAEVTASGLRGRGGAGFPAGIKWKTVRTAAADVKFVCCNADEGDSGTFADRMLIEGDPFTLIEGMTIAALAVGATEGYVYLRSEYPHAIAHAAPGHRHRLRARGLGESVLGSGEVRPRRAGGRRRLHLRRGDLDARVASRASAARCAPSRRSRPWRGCSAGRRSSTTCSRWARCRWSSPTVARPTPRWAPAAHAAPRCSSSPATSRAAASSRPTSACRSASSSTTSAAARHPAGR